MNEPEEENKETARRVIEELFNMGNQDVVDQIFAPDYVDHDPSNPEMSGVENIKKSVSDWRAAFPDTRNTVEDVIAEGDRVAIRWTTRATHRGEFMGVPATGSRITVAGFGIFRFSEGRIVESWDIYDAHGMLQQLGAGDEPREILDFWFGREGEEGHGEFREEWFTKDPGFDREIRDRFEPVYEEAVSGRLDYWKEEAKSCLALAILLDQFPRNMYRGDARMYAADEKAREVARHAIEHAHDRELSPTERMFAYLPFEHSEDLEDQRLSVELFRRLAEETGSEDLLIYSLRHEEIVERFGRFPHRNGILGRTTTSEEAEFLEGPNSSF